MLKEYRGLNLVSSAIIIVNQQGTILWVNDSCEQLFNTSKNRLINHSVFLILTPIQQTVERSDSEEFPLEQSSEQKLMQQHKVTDTWIHGLNEPLYVDYRVNSIGDDANAIDSEVESESKYVIEINAHEYSDIAMHNSYQDNQYKVARTMLRSVAHEIKNPLAGIRGASQLLQKLHTHQNSNTLRDDGDNDSNSVIHQKVHTYTDIIINETDRLNNLISQLLGTNKPPTLASINIHKALEHVLTLASSQYPHIKIKRDYDLSLPKVFADKQQMIQVFLNLVNNALDALNTSHDDTIDAHVSSSDVNVQSPIPQLTVTTRVDFRKKIHTTSGELLYKNIAKISIHDNGCGIPQEILKHIFFPLVTGKAEGTGLGLALVHSIIERHEGTVEVMSTVSDTCFTVYLPFADS